MRFAPLFLLISISTLGQNSQSLKFVENKGQWNSDIDFQAHVPGGRVGVSASAFSILLVDTEQLEQQHLASHGILNESDAQSANEPVNGHYFQINLLGSNHQSRPIVEMPLEGHYNYFIGNDSSRWASNAQAFGSILYQDVYAGIDFRVSSIGNNLKYDFVVKPGADPSQIKIEYSGTNGIELEDNELKIQTSVGPLTEVKPFSYQAIDRNRQTISSEYRISKNVVSFFFPDGYDRDSELIIDPLLIFSYRLLSPSKLKR
jgi:hypothetical protein